MKLVAVALALSLGVVACGCKGGSATKPGPGTGTGTGTPTGTGGDPAACDGIAAHVTELYQAAAERTKMTEAEVADNVAMVLAECKTSADRVVACVTKATAVTQLESSCLAPLDDEGSEGERFR
ncbi:MAG: hypothetical protein IPL61_11930 [Myxococcales bacterium]|nr:hypothetical protein [Myxococcales bacterium]